MPAGRGPNPVDKVMCSHEEIVDGIDVPRIGDHSLVVEAEFLKECLRIRSSKKPLNP